MTLVGGSQKSVFLARLHFFLPIDQVRVYLKMLHEAPTLLVPCVGRKSQDLMWNCAHDALLKRVTLIRNRSLE